MKRPVLPLLACLVAALVAGCGEAGSSGGDGDPASLVPADAPLYAQVALRPEGERREDALAAAGKLLRTDDPAGRIRELVEEGLAEEDLSWERDFAPWIGEEAGVWGSDLAQDSPPFAAVFAVADEEAAEAALPRLRGSHGPPEQGTYKGVEYLAGGDENVYGLVDGFLVVGELPGFKRTVDARDGDALADADRYRDAVGKLEDDRLAHVYMDVGAVVEAAAAADPQAEEQLQSVRSLLPLDELGPMTVSLQADGDAIAVDSRVTGVPEGPVRGFMTLFSGGETDLLASLPADAWGAYALPDVGERSRSAIQTFAGALGGLAISQQVRAATGLDLDRDVFSWLGDAAGYVTGETEDDLAFALVLESTDDERAADAFGKVVGAIGRGAGVAPTPARVDGAASAVTLPGASGAQRPTFARGEGRVVVASSPRAASQALRDDGGLGDAPLLEEAEASLGDRSPTFLLSMPAVIRLVDAMGAADAEFEEARPYLEAIEAIAGGGEVDGDTVSSRTVATFK